MCFPEVVDSLQGYCSVMRGASRVHDVQSRWADRAPLFRLSEAEIARGEGQLRILGIPEGAWFVCVHSREGGYSPGDEWQHSFRNANISDYTDAMRAIVARGGWCVRVGDPTMRPLDPMAGVVDYARSSSKSDWMDLFLCARCRFFLGSHHAMTLRHDESIIEPAILRASHEGMIDNIHDLHAGEGWGDMQCSDFLRDVEDPPAIRATAPLR